jgi:tetratricopeptide (TPR) repeat protein
VISCLAIGIPQVLFPRSLLSQRPPQTPIILISVDTLRADHLSCYGYRDLETRHIDAIAQIGTLFQEVNSQVPLTLPSHVSLLTSTYPFSNGVEDHAEPLAPGAVTLGTVLKSRGYRTAAFVGGFVLDRRFGLDQGFEVYDSPFDLRGQEGIDPSDLKRPAEEVSRAAMRWLDGNSHSPFFVFVHFFDLHTPYILTPAMRTRFPRRGYDAELSYVNDTLGEFWDFLARKGLVEKALIVFLSDHGESLGEHRENTHGYFIYQSTLRVPLIIHWPAWTKPFPPKVVQPVSLLDVAPTVLQFLGIPRPAQFQGRSLVELLRPNSTFPPAEIYSESLYAHYHYGCSSLRSLRVGNYKYIEAPEREFYDLAHDPGETRNLYASQQSLALSYRERLSALRSRFHPKDQTQARAIDPGLVERLASLGYVAATGSHPSDPDSGPDPKDRLMDYAETHRAIALAYSGKLKESAAMLESVLRRSPDLVDTRNILGLLQQKMGQHEQAAGNFQKVLERDPLNLMAHYNAGVSYFKLNQLDPARKELEVALAIASSSGATMDQVTTPAEELLGRIWLEKKDYQRARRQFAQLLAAEPRNYLAQYGLGWIALQEGKLDEALRHLEAAREIQPQVAPVHTSLGTAYYQKGEVNRAQDEFAKAVELDPNSASAHYNLGLLLQKRRQPEEAAREFRRALALDPAFQPAREALASMGEGKK